VNEACNRQFDLYKLCDRDLRKRFELTAQVAIRCIAKVADAYKAGAKDTQRKFNKHSAQAYDDRIVSFKANDVVSIWTLEGRLKIKSMMGKRQRDLLAHRKGERDLMLIRRP
jgi:putative transposase